MLVRRRSVLGLAVVLLGLPMPGCLDEDPERGGPVEQDSEEDGGEDMPICVEQCDPVEQDCEAGYACLPANPGFSCQPLASGGTSHGLHDACEVGYQTCDAGLVCLQAAAPGCTGGTACCVLICDVNRPECSDGTTCYPFYEESAMCYPDVGACVLF